MGVCQFLPLSSSSHLFFFVFCPKVCEGAVHSACIAKRYKTHLILTARTNVGGFLLAPENLPCSFQGGKGGRGAPAGAVRDLERASLRFLRRPAFPHRTRTLPFGTSIVPKVFLH